MVRTHSVFVISSNLLVHAPHLAHTASLQIVRIINLFQDILLDLSDVWSKSAQGWGGIIS